MTLVIDTSLWIELLKDKTGHVARIIDAEVADTPVILLPPIRMELLQGCRGDAQWSAMSKRLDAFELRAMPSSTWDGAARIYFDLRQLGRTVTSAIDCCIAQAGLDESLTLLHCDQDFETIATARALSHRRLLTGNPAQ